jgi:hypothetical protein
VRGVRAEEPPRKAKADLIIVAARYEAEGHRLLEAKAYQAADQVWTDVLLITRADLVDRLQRGRRVAIGRVVDLAADFEIEGRLRLSDSGGEVAILADGGSGPGDDLGVPLF